MNVGNFENASLNMKKIYWSDEELQEIIDVLECMFVFVSNMEKNGIITSFFRKELVRFCDMKNARSV